MEARAMDYQEINFLTYKKEEQADSTENTEPSLEEAKEEKQVVETEKAFESIAKAEPQWELTADLLGMEEISSTTVEIEQKNAFALSIIQPGDDPRTTTSTDLFSSASGWELALVSTPSNNTNNVVESKLAGGFDKLLLDSLYEDASRRGQIVGGSYIIDSLNTNSFESRNPFIMSSGIEPPTNLQMTLMAQQQEQQQYYYQHHHQQQQQQHQYYYQQQQMSQHYQQQLQQQQMMLMVPYGYQDQNHHLQEGQTNPFSGPFTEYSQSTPSQGSSSLI